MIVKVKYYKEAAGGYAGNSYTYRTNLPLKVYDKVIAPTYEGTSRALAVETDLPEDTIKPEWADRVKTITERDNK